MQLKKSRIEETRHHLFFELKNNMRLQNDLARVLPNDTVVPPAPQQSTTLANVNSEPLKGSLSPTEQSTTLMKRYP